jgi:hypothetical protein
MPRRILKWASYYVGNRGVMLFILGLIWALIGVGTVTAPRTVPLPDSIIPLWVRSLFWIMPGIYAMAWTLLTPMMRTDDHNVWALLMVGPTARFVTYVAAGIMDVFNIGHDQERYRGILLGVLVWLAVLAMVDRCAVGLDRLPPVRPGRTNGLG